MLREFRVDNYKSLINGVFRPQGMNLLLGKNNAGKTNLCQALRFVAGSAFWSLDKCADVIARGRFGMTNFALDKLTIDFHVSAHIPFRNEKLRFEYALTISPPRSGFVDAKVRLDREVLSVTGGVFAERTILLENDSGRIRLLDESNLVSASDSDSESRGFPGHYRETTAPTDATMLQRLYEEESNARANCFKNYLGGWSYYDLSPSSMRGTAYKPGTAILDPDGNNLASVLFMLKTSRERDYRRLLEVMRQIEPRLDLINFSVSAERSVFMLLEDSSGHALPAINASNGTLRFLAMAYVLLSQSSKEPRSPLYIIEEPENGIYVGLLKTLLDMVDQSPGHQQLVFTSHAPYFIDIFDAHLRGLFVLNHRQGHTSITQPDIDVVKKRIESFPLGEQHFREMM